MSGPSGPYDVRVSLEFSARVGRLPDYPVAGGYAKLQDDPHWRDHVFFHEYFHGDNAAGLGASHQTGWTGIVADIIRRRHGVVPPLGEVLRSLGEQQR